MPEGGVKTYNELTANRMLKLAKVIGLNPGICLDDLYEVYKEAWPGEPSSKGTINSTLRLLKEFELLPKRPNRHGYYLTERAIDPDEQDAILVALRLHGVDLGNPYARKMHQELLERLPRNAEDRRTMAYPVEAIGQRRIVDTSGEDTVRFMEGLRPKITRGSALRLKEARDLYDAFFVPKEHVVYPLQLLYHDIAWYLLFEYAQPTTTRFHVIRLDRLEPRLTVAPELPARGPETQLQSLREARGHLSYGWGIAVPDKITPDHLVRARVRFKREVVPFLHEVREHFRSLADIPDEHREAARIERRHDGDALIVELTLADHVGVQHEFMRWVATWGDAAEVLAPEPMRAAMKARHVGAARVYGAQFQPTPAPPEG
ncbi:MAG: WYL domain-containing protein [Candidatus Sericytochromatia bacterium]|nr:WYL domain-containing protein [Candidatus Sericytochromatia bacterium]